MKPEDFELFAGVVKQRSGLVLTADKAYLVESRLPPVARKWNLATVDELVQTIRSRRDESLMDQITEAMTASETHFFRDRYPFAHFRTVLLRQFLQTRAAKKKIRIWSAATASGQEAYSFAMICAGEVAALEEWKVDIVGTDLSVEMIERAKSGFYSQFEVQRGLPVRMLVEYFEQSGDKWQIKEALRRAVQFRTGNLLHDFGPVGMFDVICCRNVLLNLDPPTRARVQGALAAVMAPDGVLFLGATETTGISEKLKPVEGIPGAYILAATSGMARAAG